MKLVFDNYEESKKEQDEQKEVLKYILYEFIRNIDDPLACEPACRDETSPSCSYCVKKVLDEMFNENNINLDFFGLDYIKNFKIIEMEYKGER